MGEKPAEKKSDTMDFSFLAGKIAPENENVPAAPRLPELRPPAEHPPNNPESLRTTSVVTNPECSPAPGKNLSQATPSPHTDNIEQKSRLVFLPAFLPTYAITVTAILLYLALSGRIQLSATHPLESLPDLRPLAPNEFQKIPESASLPAGHHLKLGESRRFGDVMVTAVKVTIEPLEFEQFQSGLPESALRTPPVLKLWLQFKNLSQDYAFPPIDASILSHRFPDHSTDPNTLANSFLLVNKTAHKPIRLLNFLQDPDSNFLLTDQQTGRVLKPGEELLTWIPSASLPDETLQPDNYVWRIQFRKGIHRPSGRGVTTLIECEFNPTQIASSSVTTP
jgi:hypothetical protein